MLFCFGDGGQRIAHNSVHSGPSNLAPLSSCSASQDASNGLSVASGPNFFNGAGVNSKFTDCVDHGEAVAAAVLLGGGRVVAKVIIINMNKTNTDGNTHTDSLISIIGRGTKISVGYTMSLYCNLALAIEHPL